MTARPDLKAPYVSTRRDGDIAVVSIDNPPVNALSNAVRAQLFEAFGSLADDATLKAIVLIGAGRGFSAGADIRELSLAATGPTLPDLIARIEAMNIPVVAALHGPALGGGLELALGAHYRIALPSASLGLPEIKLGLIPGAGGTQRLPRLIGLRAAQGMLLSGDPVNAPAAARSGLVDELIESGNSPADLLAAALASARRVVSQQRGVRMTSKLAVKSTTAEIDAATGVEAATRKPQLAAATRLREALRAAATLSFEEGMAVERNAFLALRASPESRALRHAFQAEREAARLPPALAGAQSRIIESVGVVGAGTMGQGIALAFAEAGISVKITDTKAAVLAAALTAVTRICESRVKRGKLSAELSGAILGRLRTVASIAELQAADLVIEAVFEDPEVKQAVMRQIDAVARPGAIIATNTSYLDVDTLAEATCRPEDVVGLHFFSPAHVMRLIEVVAGKHTAPAVQASALTLGKRLDKHAVLVGNCRGFLGNRMLARRTREAYFLLEEGATPWQVDQAFMDFGFPMGPFAVGDLAGLDIGWRNRRTNFSQLTPREQACDILDQLVAAGRLGQKAGRGFYRYDEQRRGQPDAEVEALIERHSQRVGIERRHIEASEILQRCLYAMIDEGARILGAGFAQRSSDIDVVWLHGYGFPRHRGGPMQYADETGLPAIRAAILNFQARFGSEYWTVAPVLEQLAASGGSFAAWRLRP